MDESRLLLFTLKLESDMASNRPKYATSWPTSFSLPPIWMQSPRFVCGNAKRCFIPTNATVCNKIKETPPFRNISSISSMRWHRKLQWSGLRVANQESTLYTHFLQNRRGRCRRFGAHFRFFPRSLNASRITMSAPCKSRAPRKTRKQNDESDDRQSRRPVRDTCSHWCRWDGRGVQGTRHSTPSPGCNQGFKRSILRTFRARSPSRCVTESSEHCASLRYRSGLP